MILIYYFINIIKMTGKKTKTLYSNSNHIDISSILSKESNNKKNTFAQHGGKKKDKNVSDDEIEESEEEQVEESDNESEESELEELEEESEEVEGEQVSENEDSEDEEEIEATEDDKTDIKEGDTKCLTKNIKEKTQAELDLLEYFKDDDDKIIKTGRLCKPILFKYEKVRLLADRSRQLAQGAKPMIKNTTGLSHKEIALLELKNKLIPLIIERPIPNAGTEKWRLSELEIPE